MAHHLPGLVLRNPVHQFISKWMQKVEARSPAVAAFEDAHGKPFDCMNVFEVERAEVAKCFGDGGDDAAAFSDLEAVRNCVMGVKNDVSAGLYAYPMSVWTDHVSNPKQYVEGMAASFVFC